MMGLHACTVAVHATRHILLAHLAVLVSLAGGLDSLLCLLHVGLMLQLPTLFDQLRAKRVCVCERTRGKQASTTHMTLKRLAHLRMLLLRVRNVEEVKQNSFSLLFIFLSPESRPFLVVFLKRGLEHTITGLNMGEGGEAVRK